MSRKVFTLLPFSNFPHINLTGEIQRTKDIIDITYRLIGDINSFIIPLKKSSYSRTTKLWEETCFELFFTHQNTSKYWEINISPSGDWNIFNFSDYRKDLKIQTCSTPIINSTKSNYNLEITAKFNLESILKNIKTLNIGCSAVLKHKTQGNLFYALKHTRAKPDFHARDCFIMEL